MIQTMRTLSLALVLVLSGCSSDTAPVPKPATPNRDPVEKTMSLEQHTARAQEHLKVLNSVHADAWGLGTADNWAADQQTGVLKWTFDDGSEVTAEFQIIGTYNTKDNTFLWGWDHPSIIEPRSQDARKVRAFAEQHNWQKYQQRKIQCSEEEAWDIAANATLICDRQGAYRGPSGSTYVFMTFGEPTISKAP